MIDDHRYNLLPYFFMLYFLTRSPISALPFMPSLPRRAPKLPSMISLLSSYSPNSPTKHTTCRLLSSPHCSRSAAMPITPSPKRGMFNFSEKVLVARC